MSRCMVNLETLIITRDNNRTSSGRVALIPIPFHLFKNNSYFRLIKTNIFYK